MEAEAAPMGASTLALGPRPGVAGVALPLPLDFLSPCICLSRARLGLGRSGGRKCSRGAYAFPGAWVRPALGETRSLGVIAFLKSTFTTSEGDGG